MKIRKIIEKAIITLPLLLIAIYFIHDFYKGKAIEENLLQLEKAQIDLYTEMHNINALESQIILDLTGKEFSTLISEFNAIAQINDSIIKSSLFFRNSNGDYQTLRLKELQEYMQHK